LFKNRIFAVLNKHQRGKCSAGAGATKKGYFFEAKIFRFAPFPTSAMF